MQDSSMHRQWRSSHIGGANAAYVDELYESWLTDPNSVPEDWRAYFEKLPPLETAVESDVPHSAIREYFLLQAKNRSRVQRLGAGAVSTEHERRQVRVLHLIAAYRNRGHQLARLDPLQIMEREDVPDLELSHHGLSQADLDTVFQTGNLFIGKPETTLRDIVDCLQSTYCSTVGAEYMHIVNTAEKRWIQQRMESVRSHPQYSADVKKHLLERLTAAEGLEKYLGSKYPGTKRFGLEGGESLIPLVDEVIQRAGSYGVKEIVIGMAHRGRLNVLVNTLGKSPRDLFGEFEGKSFIDQGSGDVKYHQGFSSNVSTPGGEVHLAMAFNPSHLEIVSPVVEGSVRARQDRRIDGNGDQVVPLLIHGDAAFAGQGVVMETFQMSQTRGFKTGGTVHVIINNQIGFTTSRREDARSTEYCTDVAKMVQAPIFHVNADDPEAVYFVTQLAMDYRQQFKKDVVIDLICYRRLGHNEADEPSSTQPLMYKQIKSHPTTWTLYVERLINDGVISEEDGERFREDYRRLLDEGNHVVKSLVKEPNKALFVDWSPYLGHEVIDEWDTGVELRKLQDLANRLETLPDGVVVQRQVKKILEDRRKMTAGALAINWGYAETLAYATLIDEGFPVRLTGQDSGRGTFSHRHAVIHNQKNGDDYVPLQHLYDGQPEFEIYDSLLSEEAVLAFEYGYATTAPKSLVIWEAQFGDFANGAQVVIDQFISSGESKWARICGLTLLLPHGYEGQGPEHSSARLERFLQLCAEHNIQVCTPTTPAQIFHLLRRQAVRPLRKPLVIMSPKSLLRHKRATSTLEDLAHDGFQTVIDDHGLEDADAVKRMVLCGGKVYYDLLEKREADGITDTAIVRIEQLYPFPEQRLADVARRYPNLETAVWCQEEPQNQGAWYCSQHHMRRVLNEVNKDLYLHYAGRDGAAAPAAGSMSLHVEQQQKLVQDAFEIK
ncbi:MAG: 2-oxoglutarate dehydrogenase E1 component [Alcanivoracaceae bacterium]|jgi:2-oxoglutarate dehydrogenase E1 component|nr:2-oxoglutarate dehydrogenase E1 component [Alcanivoracaceae bacterium]